MYCSHSSRHIPIAANMHIQHTTACWKHDAQDTWNDRNTYNSHIITTIYKKEEKLPFTINKHTASITANIPTSPQYSTASAHQAAVLIHTVRAEQPPISHNTNHHRHIVRQPAPSQNNTKATTSNPAPRCHNLRSTLLNAMTQH